MKHPLILVLAFVLIGLLRCVDCYAFLNRDVHLLTMQDGLSDNNVTCIYKDVDGFMWFGTNNGLSRYDGASVKSFKMDSVPYTDVTEIYELSEHCLGILIRNTLWGFDRLTERFIPVEIAGGTSSLIQIVITQNKLCWGISYHHLYLFEIGEKRDKEGSLIGLVLKTKETVRHLVKEGNYLTRFTLSYDNKELYLTDNHANLVIYDLKKRAVTGGRYLLSECLPENSSVNITSIFDEGDKIWITTRIYGIIRYYKHTGHIYRISYTGEGENNLLSHTDVYGLVPINNGRLLAVTWNGYTIITPGRDSSEGLTTSIYNNVSLVNRNLEIRMISVYYDSQGILWIGTNGGGVMYSDLRLQYFNQFHQDRHNEICGITADDKGYIWLATFHKGIMKSREPFNPLEMLDFDTVGSREVKSRETVLCLLKDEDGNIWFGNQDGTLSVYDKSGTFRVYTLYWNGLINKSPIWSLYIDTKKNFWIGTKTGLLKFNPATGECRRMKVQNTSLDASDMDVRAIAETKDGKVWLGLELKGLGRVVNNESVNVEYNELFGLQDASARSLLASSDGLLYVGYENGFAVIQPEKEKMENFYTTGSGLCNNFIGCITEDAKGQIWLGSNSGISRYSRHQRLFYHYYISGSNRTAFLHGDNLFFGNNKSLTYFNPENINAFPFSEVVAVSTLEVGNKTVNIGEEINGQVILNNNLFYTKEIELNDRNRDFSLTFNNLSYSDEQQKLRYRLFPYQTDWMIGNRGEKISYANLRAGEYMFEVQNLFPDERMGKMTSLKVVILPHWSETVWFKLSLLGLALMIVLWTINRFRIRQKRLEHELQLEHEVFTANVERDKEKQIRLERENFFTNASHELRTPLTLILSPLQELLQTLSSADVIYKKLIVVYRNAASLHTLVDHLLYVQKIEAGMVKLRLSQTDIVTVVEEVVDSFRQIAETKGFDFDIQLPAEPLVLWIDVEKISSAIRNLLSNAFKYTSPRGRVILRMERVQIDGQAFCKLTVSDTGKGIPEELQERVFDSFITGDQVPMLSTKVGIGLRIVKNTMDLHHGSISLKSSPQEGSTFVLAIPEGNAHFSEDKYELVETPVNEETDIPVPVSSSVAEQEKEAGNKKSLLIIEDNEEVRAYICSLFCKNYTLYEAANGEEGVRIATEKIPNLIISDIMMPVKDGFVCCREIRERPCTAHIPILMLTAKAEDADILYGSKVGADDYILKPFNPEILKSRVENLILQRERLKRIYTKALMLKQKETKQGEAEEVADDFMKGVIQVIEANLADENFNVKILAEQLNMSQPTLYRKIKQRSELAAIDIIRSIRMSKAASLIMENRYSIQEIAEMVGYSDTRTLRKHFTEQFGVSPSKYIDKPEMQGS